MPLFAYSCKCGLVMKKLMRVAKDAPPFLICIKCGNSAKKLLSAPSQQSKISIDNGIQARAVEINPDIVEINKARSEKDYRQD